MNTQDETIIREVMSDGQTAASRNTTGKNGAARWQMVSIGGVTGIAMGIGAARAMDAFAATEEGDVTDAEAVNEDNQAAASDDSQTAASEEATTATEVHEATVSQGQSFGAAFAAARAEVGPGGVFMWHGRLYNTYTAEEWQAMSDAQKDEFAADVQPLLAQQTVQTQHVEHHTVSHHEETVVHVRDDKEEEHSGDDDAQQPEVHFLGVESREVEGQTVNVGRMTVDDVNVALVDVDNDRVFDVRLMDRNRNGEIEDNEIEDVSERELSVDDFQLLSQLEEQVSQETGTEQASSVQEDLAPDMPDYMNDANLETI